MSSMLNLDPWSVACVNDYCFGVDDCSNMQRPAVAKGVV